MICTQSSSHLKGQPEQQLSVVTFSSAYYSLNVYFMCIPTFNKMSDAKDGTVYGKLISNLIITPKNRKYFKILPENL